MAEETNQTGCLGVVIFFVGFGIMYLAFQADSQFLLILGIIVGSVGAVLLMIGHNQLEKSRRLPQYPVVSEPLPRPAPQIGERKNFTDNEFKTEIQSQLNTNERNVTRIHWVEDNHRTHPWSVMPGGCTVVVIYSDKQCRGYDKVKRPHKYLKKVSEDYISNFRSNRRISTLEEYIECLYAVKEGQVKLNLVWRKGNRSSPWDSLEPYSTK